MNYYEVELNGELLALDHALQLDLVVTGAASNRSPVPVSNNSPASGYLPNHLESRSARTKDHSGCSVVAASNASEKVPGSSR